MKSEIFLIMAITGLLVLAGCGQEGESIGVAPYIGGDKGLIAEFEPMGIEEQGVYTIYQDENFPIQIVVKNKGEEDVDKGDLRIELYGIPLADFGGISAAKLSNAEKIEKISEISPEGGEVTVDFGKDAKYAAPIAGGFYDATVFANLIYKYKTYVSVPKVCFKEDFRDTEVCTVDEAKTSYSSAAPIQVKSVKEIPAGAGIIGLEFEVENVGGGDAAVPGKEFPLRYSEVAYAITPASEEGKWGCTAAGRPNEARLTDGKATIRCKLNEPLPKGTKYTKQVGIELSYDYKDIVQETVRIKKP